MEWNSKAADRGTEQPYEAEAKQRWGDTPAYRAYTERTKDSAPEEMDAAAAGLEEIFGDFAACMKQHDPASPEAAALTERLRGYLSAHYYTCSDEILSGLGEMYAGDERFRRSIDRHGAGTAAFVRQAIQARRER